MAKAKAEVKPKLPKDYERLTDEELAAFWEAHSFVDYWDEMEEADLSFTRGGERQLGETISVRLAREDAELVRALAGRLGVGASRLIRIWIKEKLREVRTQAGARQG